MGRRGASLVSPLQPDLAIEATVLVPARVDLDMQEQVDRAAEMLSDLGARRSADLLQPAAALADDNRLLAIALDEDLLADGGRAIGSVFPGLGLDGGRVG